MSNLERFFPKLKDTGYKNTSPANPAYNCLAWALGDQQRWLEAEPIPGYYWPKEIPRDGSVRSAVALFERDGFAVCDDGTVEVGFEKIAIYGDRGSYTHAARQLEDGKWTSKIGRLEDIEHELDGLVGQEYGLIAVFMKRVR